MKNKKVFYIIEPIDVDGDKIPDGFLASQYRIDKYGNKIFLKNKFITFADFNAKINKKGGAKRKNTKVKLQKNNNNLVVMTKDEYNKFMNQNAYYQQYPHQPNNPYPQYPQYPPNVLINTGNNIPYNPNNNFNNFNNNPNYPNNPNNPNYPNNNDDNTFMGKLGDSVTRGVGLGIGLNIGDALFDGVSSFF
jgi:hypothetical protein